MTFQLTVVDEETGESTTRRVSEGDYVLLTFAPCYLDGLQTYGNGTRVLTIKDHQPVRPSDNAADVPRAHAVTQAGPYCLRSGDLIIRGECAREPAAGDRAPSTLEGERS